MRTYAFVTLWHINAPVETVWAAITDMETWPSWWRYVERVETLDRGEDSGLGSLRRITWTSRLTYRLSFEIRTTRLDRPVFLEGTAVGELNGVGRWYLTPDGRTTRVRYEWDVSTTKRWMNWFYPILWPAFQWNHDQVMNEGGRSLARHLGVTLIET